MDEEEIHWDGETSGHILCSGECFGINFWHLCVKMSIDPLTDFLMQQGVPEDLDYAE